jgi:tripartite-type tricarboxylate transporter receptor subunit TctC
VGVAGLSIPWWQGFWVPKDTPSEIVKRLNAAVVKALDDPVVSRRLTDLGVEIPSGDLRTPEGVRAFLKSEIDTWWPVIKAANIKVE